MFDTIYFFPDAFLFSVNMHLRLFSLFLHNYESSISRTTAPENNR